jgi:electron transfer flavoprotein alpha subunit
MFTAKKINRLNSIFNRFKSTLVIVEHDNQHITPITLNAITAATQIPKNETVTCLVIGTGCQSVADSCSKISGVSKVLLADNAAFKGFMPETLAPFIVGNQKKFSFSHIVMGSSAFGKNLIPRVAALLDVQPISDIISIKDENTFVRTIYAGNAIQTVKSNEPVNLFTVRGTAYEPAKSDASSQAQVTAVDDGIAQNSSSSFVGQELAKSDRPSLTSAKVVVSGGRGLQNGESNFVY